MSNKDLLKQAIAEAKTIREAAIANAKEALEETLTPHLKDMLAAKLQEMELAEEEVVDETINNAEAETYAENPSKHGNLDEVEEEEEEAEEEETPEEGEEGEEEEELEIEDMSVEDLKNLIRDIVAQETGHDEEAEIETGEETPEGEEDMISMDGDSEEIDINELLAELEGITEDDGYGKVKEIPGKGTHSYSRKPGSKRDDVSGVKGDGYKEEVEEGWGSGAAAGTPGRDTGKELDTQLVNFLKTATPEIAAKVKAFIKGLPAGAGAAIRSEGAEEVEEGFGSGAAAGNFSRKDTGKELDTQLINFLKTATPEVLAKIKAFAKELPAAAGAAMRSEEVQEELNEALQAVRILRNQLQEVNLLNAKLLYVNKVFKSNNLSEGQKVNVIAAFDKAETVKEVKLVFETVSKNVVAKPAALKEHRSFASKATGNAQTTAPKEILSEVSEQVQRWQKLAGIIKS